MIKIQNLVKDHFDDNKISNQNLLAGADDHLARLKAHVPGTQFQKIIDTTISVLEAYRTENNKINTSQTRSRGATVTVNEARANFLAFIREARFSVNAILKTEPEPERLRFYPNGLTEYTNARRDQWKALGERYLAAATEFETQLTPQFVDAVQTHLDAYTDALANQSGEAGQISDSRADRRANRKPLTLQLTANLHELCLAFRNNPNHAATFFKQRFFNTSAANNPNTPDPLPAGGAEA